MIITEWLFQEPFKNKIKKIYNPKLLKQIANEINKIEDKQINKVLAKKMINPNYFTDKALKVGFIVTLERHHIKHANSKVFIKPNYPEFGIEVRYINKTLKEMVSSYVRLMNRFKFKHQTSFSARFDKQVEDNQVLDEIELSINLKINHNLTETDIDIIDIKSPLEQQLQNQKRKLSARNVDRKNSMTIYLYKTGERNSSSYVKIHLRTSAILKLENNDKCCFLWSILAELHPCNNSLPNRISNYRKNFVEIILEGFDFSNGFKCSNSHKFKELNNLSTNEFESNFYQDQNERKYKLIPIEISKN